MGVDIQCFSLLSQTYVRGLLFEISCDHVCVCKKLVRLWRNRFPSYSNAVIRISSVKIISFNQETNCVLRVDVVVVAQFVVGTMRLVPLSTAD